MRTSDFDFELPEDRVAVRPVEPRDAARLLVVDDPLEDRIVRDLPDLFLPGDLMIVNDTRVIPARLFGRRGEVKVEATLIKRDDDTTWRALAKPGKRLRVGDRIDFAGDLAATVAAKDGAEITLVFTTSGPALMAAIHRVGVMPLPPYIRREADADDAASYQTVFAAREGAVAAPTAGLHFTPELLERLAGKGIERAAVTLHVGAGTFLPVKVEDTSEHRMHSEWCEVPEATAAKIAETRARGGRIVAIGTTAMRTLESAARADGTVPSFAGDTDIFITPGYRFRAVDVLLTNFHLPRSTLFMLVSAFSGVETMRAAYAHAIASGYRFFSYGDACLLRRSDP